MVTKQSGAKNATKKTPAKKAAVKKSAVKAKTVVKKPVAKPKIRVSKLTGSLDLPKNSQAVVDLKKDWPPVALPVRAKKTFYTDEPEDPDLPQGEDEADNDELLNEPVESLGELLTDDEKIDYSHDRPVAAKKVASAPEPGRFQVFKKLALVFVILALLLGAAAVYFLLVKTSISIKLKNEAVAGELNFNIYDQNSGQTIPAGAVKGLIKKIELADSQTFTVTGTEIIGQEVSGQVTLYNKYIKSQPLVATTRLLSADGKLLRLKNSVTVPAGGQIEAEVYAEEPNADMQIGEAKFTIPGLWEGLQDKIYAESQAGQIVYKEKVKRVVKQEDIDQGVIELKNKLIDKAKADLTNSYADFNQQLYKFDEATSTINVDAKIGEEKDQIMITLKGSIIAVAFSAEAVADLAKAKATGSLTGGKELINLPTDSMEYSLETLDLTNGVAQAKAKFAGQVAVTSLNNFLDKNKLLNLNEDQLNAYLRSLPEIESYQVQFFPAFIRKTPSLVDRLELSLE